ncbi:MAG: sialate O-acetylesterase [Treponema sp.]|nr:sialate O-acetylesterase [Treponema sp.]
MKYNNDNSDTELHIYIAFGQSNMQGPGPIRDRDKQDISERWQVLNVAEGSYDGQQRDNGQWYKAVPPLITAGDLKHWQDDFSTGLSPADYFGRFLVANTPPHITIGLIAVAGGALALASFHKTKSADYFSECSGGAEREDGRPSITERQGWDRYRSAGYDSMYDAIITNVKLAQSQGGIVKGIIFHQGESGRGLTYTTWGEMLKEIYDDMLADLELQPNSIPILCGQTWDAGSGSTDGALVGTQALQNKTGIPNAHVISSGGLTAGRPVVDNLHFGSEDIQAFGIRYGEKMLELVYLQKN